jgi:hypothetical protein
MFDRLSVYARSLRLVGAGLALTMLGSAAVAQNAANGKLLYAAKSCALCHLSDPTINKDFILSGANDPQRILLECRSEPQMVAFCAPGKPFEPSLQEATDIAAYLANPNNLGPAMQLDRTALSFGRAINNGASGRQTITVTNTGAADLVLNTLVVSGNNAADFALLAPLSGTRCVGGLSIPPAASCAVDVTFDPPAVGARAADLVITAVDVSAQTITLNGVGTAQAAPFAIQDVTDLNFGNQLLNTTGAAKTVTLRNVGDANLVLDAVDTFALSGAGSADYVVGSGGSCAAGGTVAEGASCTLQISFAPKAVGNRAATVTVGSNGADLTVNLAGNGLSPDDNEGEGGCSTINPNARFDPMLMALLAAAMAVLGVRRRRSRR